MAIDRIGKGGGLPPPDVQGTGGPAKPGSKEPFKVDRSTPSTETTGAERAGQAGAASAADAVDASSALGRLRAGEVDVHGYIDLKVDEATASLKGLPPSELEDIKSVLRDQMRTDPGLAELVRSATGSMPSPPED